MKLINFELPADCDLSVEIARADIAVRRHPLETPVRTSFGTMTDRPAVFVRVEDREGAVGYGEIWCNFPACGAEHRARLFETVITPLTLKRRFEDPGAASEEMTRATHILSLQSAEIGPIAQTIAGLDIALWDLVAKRHGLPLYRLLGGASDRIKAYASGINPKGVVETVERLRGEGFSLFKLKIGFGEKIDLDNARSIRSNLRDGEGFMVDANQAWTIDEALMHLKGLEETQPNWIEEPLAADVQPSDWRRLKAACGIAIAGGENFLAMQDYERAIEGDWLDVIQPDVAKWGGISGCHDVASKVIAGGKTYCPHSLGGGVALAASAHLLAAVGGDGVLEVDGNRNPLREDVFPIRPEAGRITLSSAPGLGVETEVLEAFFDRRAAAIEP